MIDDILCDDDCEDLAWWEHVMAVTLIVGSLGVFLFGLATLVVWVTFR